MVDFEKARHDMVAQQIARRGIKDSRVLQAMGVVERHRFVPQNLLSAAYDDGPLPIGGGQTISQPYIVASMTEMLHLPPQAKVLEIGTGCGYQTAVLAEIAAAVFSLEIVEDLAKEAIKRLSLLGYRNVQIRCGDGYRGWPEEAPFDGILVAAAPQKIPPALIEQLKVGGRLVIPLGDTHVGQDLRIVEKSADGSIRESIQYPVRFVPFTGVAQDLTQESDGNQ